MEIISEDMRARTWDEISGPQSEYRADGGSVVLMVELILCHATVPDDPPLSSYRICREVWSGSVSIQSPGTTQRTLRCTLCGLGGGASTLAAGGGEFGKSNPEGREVEVRFLQTVYSKQYGGFATGVSYTGI